jgi:hypothetical protein
MALYTGGCDTLELVACNEDYSFQTGNYWSGINTDIQSGNTYYVAVDGFNYSGFGSPESPLTTGEFCLSTQQPQVSVSEPDVRTVSVYPNPSNGTVTITADSPILEVVVCDVTGKQLLSLSGGFSEIWSSLDLPDVIGFYLLHIKTDRGIFTSRVMRK